eukprot:1105950-Pleurochrysis_carterae.AAC.1
MSTALGMLTATVYRGRRAMRSRASHRLPERPNGQGMACLRDRRRYNRRRSILLAWTLQAGSAT